MKPIRRTFILYLILSQRFRLRFSLHAPKVTGRLPGHDCRWADRAADAGICQTRRCNCRTARCGSFDHPTEYARRRASTTCWISSRDIRASSVPVVVYVAPKKCDRRECGCLDHHGRACLRHGAGDDHRRIQPDQRIGRKPRILGCQERKPPMPRKPPSVTLCSRAAQKALALAEAMIDEAKAATAKEALKAHLIDFVVDNMDDLLEALDGFTVQVNDRPRTLNTASARDGTARYEFYRTIPAHAHRPEHCLYSCCPLERRPAHRNLQSRRLGGRLCRRGLPHRWRSTAWACCRSTGLALSSC